MDKGPNKKHGALTLREFQTAKLFNLANYKERIYDLSAAFSRPHKHTNSCDSIKNVLAFGYDEIDGMGDGTNISQVL